MFIDAEICSLLVDGQVCYYLEVREAAFAGDQATRKRLRLSKRKHDQILGDGGMLVTSARHIEALRAIGVTEVSVDTDRSGVILDEWLEGRGKKPGRERTRTTQASAESEAWASALAAADELPFDFVEIPGPPAESFTSLPPAPAPTPAGPRRATFGRGDKAWMKVEIKGAGEQAILQVLSFGGDRSLGEKHLLQALEELYGIRAGIDQAMVAQLAVQATAFPTQVIRGQYPIARQAPPDPGQFGHLEYTFQKSLPKTVPLAYDRLRRAFAQLDLQQVLDPELRVRLVLPGEELAVFVPAGSGQVIRDIFGNTQPRAGVEALLRPGPHVRLSGGRYLAEIYGYACLLDDELSVVPPLWISPLHMEAHFIYFPHFGPGGALTWEWLAELLNRQGICYGLCEAEIAALLQTPPTGPQPLSLLVARGTPPEEGSDTLTTLHFGAGESTSLPGRHIDVQGLHQSQKVRAGQLLAELKPAPRRRPGTDLAGRTLPPPPEESPALKAGRHVRSSEGDGGQRFFAEIDGCARVQKGVLAVNPVVYLDQPLTGELDLSDTDQDLYLRGPVRAGAVVKVKGSVAIEGEIEDGASLYALGDVVVGKGIQGRQTQVVALGDVAADFIQHSSVRAQGNVAVASHLAFAQVSAGGQLVVGGGTGGSIVGGQSWASVAIAVGQAGSAAAEDTLLGIRPGPASVARLRKLDQSIEFCRTNTLRIFRTLGMSEIDVVRFKALIDESPPTKRQALIQLVLQLKSLVQTREKLLATKQTLEQEQVQAGEKAQIQVSGTAFAGVQISVGGATVKLERNLDHPLFTKTPKGIRWSTPT